MSDLDDALIVKARHHITKTKNAIDQTEDTN